MKELEFSMDLNGDYLDLYVHVPTEEIYQGVRTALHESGYKWNGYKEGMMGTNNIVPHKDGTTVLVLQYDHNVLYASTDWHGWKNNPDRRVPYQRLLDLDTEELCERLLKSIDTLEKKLT